MDTRDAASTNVAAAVWDREFDSRLVCLDVHQETADVKTFTFASFDGKKIAFRAGQYFLFEFLIESVVENRCYSISSSPQRVNAFSVTVKRVSNGKVSNWLHDNLAAGMTVTAQGPLGHFIRPNNVTKLLLLSGGSGVTPLMSMVRDGLDRCQPLDVVFMHASRTPADIIFRRELATIAQRMKGLRLHFLPETSAGEPSWCGLTGRITHEYLKLAVPDIAERTVMCCGPAPFMAAAKRISLQLGVSPTNYIEESFDAAVLDETDGEPATATTGAVYQVKFAKQARTIAVLDSQTVLSCAKKSGVKIPSSCSNGVCGTCKSRLISGSVDMKHNGGIRQREVDAGMFLPCCSIPLSDLVIDR